MSEVNARQLIKWSQVSNHLSKDPEAFREATVPIHLTKKVKDLLYLIDFWLNIDDDQAMNKISNIIMRAQVQQDKKNRVQSNE